MKRIVQILICSFAAAGFLLAGCSKNESPGGGDGAVTPPPSAPTAENVVSSGTDMSDEFFRKYSGGNYFVLNHRGRASGLANGGERLSINPDGSYLLSIVNNDVKKGEDTTVKCTTNEKGTITQVRRIKDTPASVIAASTTVEPSTIEAAIILRPDTTEVVKAEVIAQGATGTTEDADVQSACIRTAERVVLVEQFFPDAFLLATARVQGETETNNQGFPIEQSASPQTPPGAQVVDVKPTDSFFLEERLVIRQGAEWLWITGGAAHQAVEESSKVLMAGSKGLEVEGDKVQSLETKDGVKNVLGRMAFLEGDEMQLEFGTSAVGRFLPLLQVSGKLLGVSYNPSKGDVVYNLDNYKVVSVTNQLQDSGLNKDIEKTLQDAQKDIQPHHKKLESSGSVGKILSIDINVKEADRVKVRSKAREVSLPLTIPPRSAGTATSL